MISRAVDFTLIGIVDFLIFITFDPLGMKFPVVTVSAIAFVIFNLLTLLCVYAFAVIFNFFFTLANAYPPDHPFHPLFLFLPFFVSARFALETWPLRCLKHWGGVWFVFHPHDQQYSYLRIALG